MLILLLLLLRLLGPMRLLQLLLRLLHLILLRPIGSSNRASTSSYFALILAVLCCMLGACTSLQFILRLLLTCSCI